MFASPSLSFGCWTFQSPESLFRASPSLLVNNGWSTENPFIWRCAYCIKNLSLVVIKMLWSHKLRSSNNTACFQCILETWYCDSLGIAQSNDAHWGGTLNLCHSGDTNITTETYNSQLFGRVKSLFKGLLHRRSLRAPLSDFVASRIKLGVSSRLHKPSAR